MQRIKFLTKYILFMSFLGISQALGATDSHEGVPKVVFYQFLNFSLFVGLLFYLLKDKIRAFYKSRFDRFQEQFQAAQKEREDMEVAHKDYTQKLQEITTTSQEQIAKAQKEALATKDQMLKEADIEATRIQNEALSLLDLEHKKAKRQLIAEFAEKIILQVQTKISKTMTSEDRHHFIKTLEVSLK